MLLFTRLTLFISLKSLFMNNEQCQTRPGKKKKRRKRNAKNAISKRHLSVRLDTAYFTEN